MIKVNDAEYYRTEILKLIDNANEYSGENFKESPAAVVGHMTATLNIIKAMVESCLKEAQ